MKRFAFLFALSLSLVTAACNGRQDTVSELELTAPPIQPEADNPPSNQPSESAETAVPAAGQEETTLNIPDNLFTLPANPLTVKPELDGSRTATAVIPLEGGTITATAADGSRFRLEIPADALEHQTEISMTPLTTVADMPFSGGLQAAVQLAPDGLRLLNFATLTIEPAQPIPTEAQIFFGYLGDGQDFHLVIPTLDTTVTQIQLLHFSGYGLGQGTAAERTAVAQRQPSSAEIRITQQISQLFQEARTRSLTGQEIADNFGEQLEALLDAYEKEVVQPALAQAGDSCAKGKQAIQLYLSYERQRQLLGLGQEGESGSQLASLILIVGLKCVEEAVQACVQDHDLTHIIPTVLGFERQRQLLGLADETNDPIYEQMMQLVNNCFTFELEFDSVVGSDIDGNGYETAVRANVPITLKSLIPFTLSGIAPMDSMYYNTKFEDCTQGATTNLGAEFEVLSLNFILSGSGEKTEVTGLEMVYAPGTTSEKATVICEYITFDVPPEPSPVWTGFYTALHLDDMTSPDTDVTAPNPGVGGVSGMPGMLPPVMAGSGTPVMALRDWDLPKGELYATRDYDREENFMFEVTTVNLYHRPQQ